MPKGIPGSGPRVKQKRLEAKKRGNPNIRNEGADGPEAPAPSQGDIALEVKLPPAVLTAKAETAKLIAQAQADLRAERAEKARRAKVKSFKVEGNDLGWIAAFVGTSGHEVIRERLAKDAGIVYVEGDYFYITAADKSGPGADFARPTVWFECEVADTPAKRILEGLKEVAEIVGADISGISEEDGPEPSNSDEDEILF